MDMNKLWILISVTDKTGLEKFKKLTDTGRFGILSTGGTAKRLDELGIPVTLVEKVTLFPEMMDGRLKTIHPLIFGGILADRSKAEHMEMVLKHLMPIMALVVVNLYDFRGKPGIEQIDIGGPSLLRAAAKNCASTAGIFDPNDYSEVTHQLEKRGELSQRTREWLAQKVFGYTGRYDLEIARWMEEKRERDEPFADEQEPSAH